MMPSENADTATKTGVKRGSTLDPPLQMGRVFRLRVICEIKIFRKTMFVFCLKSVGGE